MNRKIATHRSVQLLSAFTLSLALSATASAAAYIKYDGIDGESKNQQPPAKTQQVKPQEPKPAGLLLPAVQKSREAPARSESSNNLKQLGVAADGVEPDEIDRR